MSREDPKGKSRATSETAITVEHRSLRFGPLPDPADLARYDQIVAGSAGRILRMAEQQAAHRQALEQVVVSADIAARATSLRLEERGQSFALASRPTSRRASWLSRRRSARHGCARSRGLRSAAGWAASAGGRSGCASRTP